MNIHVTLVLESSLGDSGPSVDDDGRGYASTPVGHGEIGEWTRAYLLGGIGATSNMFSHEGSSLHWWSSTADHDVLASNLVHGELSHISIADAIYHRVRVKRRGSNVDGTIVSGK